MCLSLGRLEIKIANTNSKIVPFVAISAPSSQYLLFSGQTTTPRVTFPIRKYAIIYEMSGGGGGGGLCGVGLGNQNAEITAKSVAL